MSPRTFARVFRQKTGRTPGKAVEDVLLFDAAISSAEPLHLELPAGRVLLNGEDVTQAIREPAVSVAASLVAALPSVRQ